MNKWSTIEQNIGHILLDVNDITSNRQIWRLD